MHIYLWITQFGREKGTSSIIPTTIIIIIITTWNFNLNHTQQIIVQDMTTYDLTTLTKVGMYSI